MTRDLQLEGIVAKRIDAPYHPAAAAALGSSTSTATASA